MKYVLITGCSNKGIGSALALSFSTQQSIHIFATSRRLSTMSDLSSTPNITLLELDVTSPNSISAALASITKTTGGKLDYLLNYAGQGYTMPYLDNDVEICQKMFDVNVFGVMRVTQAFAPLVVEAKGVIVVAGSTAELIGVPFQSAYCGSKAALHLMTETLRSELVPMGVKVLYVTTGFVESNWFANVPAFSLPENSYYMPLEKCIGTRAKGEQPIPWMKTDLYAEKVVCDILSGKKGRVYRGKTASMFSFAIRWVPGWIFDWLIARDFGLNELKRRRTLSVNL